MRCCLNYFAENLRHIYNRRERNILGRCKRSASVELIR